MIKHHPNLSMLNAFAEGQLPASLSIAVSIHCDHCPVCQQQVMAKQEAAAAAFDLVSEDFEEWHDEDMIDAICADDYEIQPTQSSSSTLSIKGYEYTLPKALQAVQLSNWLKLGKLSRARVDLNEGEVHTNLLHIDQGGAIPLHTHKGFELTLLLGGSFSDEQGDYVPGDFIWLNQSNTHSPSTQDGCLCLTVANDAMHFVQGISMALNPIGKLIY